MLRPALKQTISGHFRVNKRQRRIPLEKDIKKIYKMKIPIKVEKRENSGAVVHFLETPEAGLKLINSYIEDFKKNITKLKEEKNNLKEELENWKKAQQKEEEELRALAGKELRHYWGLLRLDSLEHQKSKIKLHKEAQQLKRDKVILTVRFFS